MQIGAVVVSLTLACSIGASSAGAIDRPPDCDASEKSAADGGGVTGKQTAGEQDGGAEDGAKVDADEGDHHSPADPSERRRPPEKRKRLPKAQQ